MTIFRGDKVALANKFDKLTQIGTVYEVANITTDNKVIIRDTVSKVAIGAIGIDDFEKYFNKLEDDKKSGWTEWHRLLDSNDDMIGIYRTNFKKVEVKIGDGSKNYNNKKKNKNNKKDNKMSITGKAFCCKEDDFNLAYGIRLAYMRAIKKSYIKNKEPLLNELDVIKLNIHNIEQQLRKMCEE